MAFISLVINGTFTFRSRKSSIGRPKTIHAGNLHKVDSRSYSLSQDLLFSEMNADTKANVHIQQWYSSGAKMISLRRTYVTRPHYTYVIYICCSCRQQQGIAQITSVQWSLVKFLRLKLGRAKAFRPQTEECKQMAFITLVINGMFIFPF